MNISFKWIGGATFILSIDDVRIAVDPVLCQKGTVQDYFWFKSKRVEEPIYEDSDFDNIDLWLITHNHEDHLDEIGLSKIKPTAKVISNKNSSKKLRGVKDITILDWQQTRELRVKDLTLRIEAIPAIHGVNPISAFFAGKVNGYYLKISKGVEEYAIYITSDTVYKKKQIEALNNKKIDLLVANMGAAQKGTWMMTLTLDSSMLKKMIAKLDPKMVIPIHYGTFEHYKEPVQDIMNLSASRIRIVEVGDTVVL